MAIGYTALEAINCVFNYQH